MEIPLSSLIPVLLGVMSISVSIAVLALRSWVKARIEHEFETKLECVKFSYAKELEKLKAENEEKMQQIKAEQEAMIESLKAESLLVLQQHSAESEAQKAALLHAVKVRAEKYPVLVGCLRTMKGILTDLHMATLGDEPETQPIDLQSGTEAAQKVKASFKELLGLKELFDRTLSQVRLFTKRSASDFSFPVEVKELVEKWMGSRKGEAFAVSDEEMRGLYDSYAENVDFLSGEFYGRPEDGFSPGSSDLWLTRQRKVFDRILSRKGRKTEEQRRKTSVDSGS